MKAFPCKAYVQDKTGVCGISEYSGMDLRDYFAAKAMQGYTASMGVVGGNMPTDDDLARYSYQLADAMMEAREK